MRGWVDTCMCVLRSLIFHSRPNVRPHGPLLLQSISRSIPGINTRPCISCMYGQGQRPRWTVVSSYHNTNLRPVEGKPFPMAVTIGCTFNPTQSATQSYHLRLCYFSVSVSATCYHLGNSTETRSIFPYEDLFFFLYYPIWTTLTS